MHLIAPNGRKRKWDIRLRLPDGRTVKIPGDRDRSTASRTGERVKMLIRAKQNGDSPPIELKSWIDNMPSVLANRLNELGLLDRHYIDRSKSMPEHIADFEQVVAGRGSNSVAHAKDRALKVRRVFNGLGISNFRELTEDGFSGLLFTWKIAIATRRHYIIALKDFSKWMVRSKRASENPLVHVKPPGQYEDPQIERQPLTVAQFQKLLKYLGKAKGYAYQRTNWAGTDRRLLYWTAVKTGFRWGELRSLRKAQLLLQQSPAYVCIKAADAKNKMKDAVPIPHDLATALRQHVAKLSPEDCVFSLPRSSHTRVRIFRRDLAGAGIPSKLPTGEIVDFHALRSTAITWWLEVDRLTAKRVQVLARLKTLALVANYSRNFRIEEFGWLDKGPKLVPSKRRKAG